MSNKPHKYRRRGNQYVELIDAIRWDGSIEHAHKEVDEFTDSKALACGIAPDLRLEVEVVTGRSMAARPGDFIVRDRNNHLVVMDPKLFEQIYILLPVAEAEDTSAQGRSSTRSAWAR